MRQLTCTAPHEIEWRDVPEPRLESDTDALVRPLAVARCDIDLFLTSGFVPLRGPFALGHEAVVEVVDMGDSVPELTKGQRAVVSFEVSCGSCRSCHAGHTAICESRLAPARSIMRATAPNRWHLPNASALARSRRISKSRSAAIPS